MASPQPTPMTAIRIHLRVNAINSAQNIVSTPITQAGQGQAYIYEVLARDPENNPITYSLKTAPNGMTINANSGRITWTANSWQLRYFSASHR
jgi:hypothetical protein